MMAQEITLRDIFQEVKDARQEVKDVDKKRHDDNHRNHALILKLFDNHATQDKRVALIEANQSALTKIVDNNTAALLVLSNMTRKMFIAIVIFGTVFSTLAVLHGDMKLDSIIKLLGLI